MREAPIVLPPEALLEPVDPDPVVAEPVVPDPVVPDPVVPEPVVPEPVDPDPVVPVDDPLPLLAMVPTISTFCPACCLNSLSLPSSM
jgi:hypothetical protein